MLTFMGFRRVTVAGGNMEEGSCHKGLEHRKQRAMRPIVGALKPEIANDRRNTYGRNRQYRNPQAVLWANKPPNSETNRKAMEDNRKREWGTPIMSVLCSRKCDSVESGMDE